MTTKSNEEEGVEKPEHHRLADECEKLEPEYEQKMADEGLLEDSKEWPLCKLS